MVSARSCPLLLGATAVLLAACGGSSGDAGNGTETPQPASFDVGAVVRNFEDVCKRPDAAILLDAAFCRDVRLDLLSGDGTILRVPTTNLGAGSVARSAVICRLFALQHVDRLTAKPFGYASIDVLALDGATSFSCSVP